MPNEGLHWSQVKTWASWKRHPACREKNTRGTWALAHLALRKEGLLHRPAYQWTNVSPRAQDEPGLITILLLTCSHASWHMCIQSWNGFPSSLMCFHLFERIRPSRRLLPKNWEKFYLHPVLLHPQIQFILHGRLLQSTNLIIFFGYLQVFKAKQKFF